MSTSRQIIFISFTVALFLVASVETAIGQQENGNLAPQTVDQICRSIQAHENEYNQIARKLWEYAEIGFQEKKSSALLRETLEKAGFSVQPGIADIPTAFLAIHGTGRPIIAILAEFDALPGLSQTDLPQKKPLIEGANGHGCGHNLFGTASTAAAIAVKNWLEQNNQTGTIRLYGTPAEENGSTKADMVRAGLFDDVDIAIHWHPSDKNDASPKTSLAILSAKFQFYGVSSHAAASPDRGRSALDAVEAMDFMTNLMREHIPQESRIHYVITSGGLAPNVVPDFAEVHYFVRHPEKPQLDKIWDWVYKTAQAAAIGTQTRMECQTSDGCYNILTNEALADIMDKNLRLMGGLTYTPEEQKFAQTIYQTLGQTDKKLTSIAEIQPCKVAPGKGSTDVGDVSWVVPTVGLNTACWVPGTAAHTWQVVAVGGMSIGFKGMNLASKVMAITAVDLYLHPEYIQKAQAELNLKRGPDYQYKPLTGDCPEATDK